MGITCPACGTENRSIAKFCIECIEALPAMFPPTEIQPRLSSASTSTPPIASRPAVFAGPPAAPPAAPSAAPAASPKRIVEPRKGLWVSVAAFGIALGIGAAGWMVAGAGGLYIYSAANSDKAPDVQATPAVLPVVAPVVTVAPVANGDGALPLSTTEIITELASDRMPSPATPAVVSSVPARAASTPRARPKSMAPPPASVPVTMPGQGPQAQCESLGFFARARCMADQCLKTEYRPHAQCEAVRRQQQLMEEKRNPTDGGA